jgi:archaellum component FlaC
MVDETLETAAGELNEVRDRLDATREALQRVLDSQDGDLDAIQQAMARLERIEAEVARIEGVCAGRAVGARSEG